MRVLVKLWGGEAAEMTPDFWSKLPVTSSTAHPALGAVPLCTLFGQLCVLCCSVHCVLFCAQRWRSARGLFFCAVHPSHAPLDGNTILIIAIHFKCLQCAWFASSAALQYTLILWEYCRAQLVLCSWFCSVHAGSGLLSTLHQPPPPR